MESTPGLSRTGSRPRAPPPRPAVDGGGRRRREDRCARSGREQLSTSRVSCALGAVARGRPTRRAERPVARHENDSTRPPGAAPPGSSRRCGSTGRPGSTPAPTLASAFLHGEAGGRRGRDGGHGGDRERRHPVADLEHNHHDEPEVGDLGEEVAHEVGDGVPPAMERSKSTIHPCDMPRPWSPARGCRGERARDAVGGPRARPRRDGWKAAPRRNAFAESAPCAGGGHRGRNRRRRGRRPSTGP